MVRTGAVEVRTAEARRSRAFAIALAALVAGVVGTATLGTARAEAVVTIGSDLAPAPVGFGCITPPCTVMNTTLPGAQLTSPINGVVVRWRIRHASGLGATVRLKVIRPAGGMFTGVNESAAQALPGSGDTTLTFPTQQPIAAGDFVGSTDNIGNTVSFTALQADVGSARWEPPLADAVTSSPTSIFSPPPGALELLVNADIEPDCDADGLGDETQDASVVCPVPPAPVPSPDTTAPDATLGGKKTQKGAKVVKVKVSCDEACTATGTGTIKVPVLKSSADAAKSKKSKLKSQTKELAAGETVTLKLKLKKKAKKLAKKAQKKGKKATANVTVTTADATGNESSAKRKIKLKKK